MNQDHRPTRPTRTRRCAPSRGFTLLEILTTMAIAAILLAIGIPSFQYVTNANRVTGEINGLLGDLQFARAEAVKEGRTVTVCTSTDGASCAGSTSWAGGWIVFSDPTNIGHVDNGETILRVQRTFSSTDTLESSNNVVAVTFNREGYALSIPQGTLMTLHDATDTSAWTRCLSINSAGMLVTQLSGTTVNGVSCS